MKTTVIDPVNGFAVSEETSEQADKLMEMSLVLGELYFSHRMIEDQLVVRDKMVEEAKKEAQYWRGRFSLLARFTSQQGIKKFSNAARELKEKEELAAERGGQ